MPLAKVATHLKLLDKIEEVSEENYDSTISRLKILSSEAMISKGSISKVIPYPEYPDKGDVEEELQSAAAQALDSETSTMFMLLHQVRDATRSRFHTGISMMAVFLVVLSSLLTTTLVSHAPTIFLRLSERGIGQFDGIVFPESGEESQEMSEFQSTGVFVNYTKVDEILQANYSDLHVSPRKQLCGTYLGSRNPRLIRALN